MNTGLPHLPFKMVCGDQVSPDKVIHTAAPAELFIPSSYSLRAVTIRRLYAGLHLIKINSWPAIRECGLSIVRFYPPDLCVRRFFFYFIIYQQD